MIRGKICLMEPNVRHSQDVHKMSRLLLRINLMQIFTIYDI